MLGRQVVLLIPPKSLHPRTLLSRQQSTPVSPLPATLMDLPASVANKRLTARLTPLDATLTKNRGAHPSSQKLFSLLALLRRRSDVPMRFLRPERFYGTILRLVFSVSQPMRHFCAKAAFVNPLLSVRCKLSEIHFPVSPLLATLTKTAGCISKIPILELNRLRSTLNTASTLRLSDVGNSHVPIPCIQLHRRLHPPSCIQSLCYPPLSAFGESLHSFYVGGRHE
jgi:hypothetical protein